MKKILITGAGGPAGVNFCKSLGISGEDFYLVGTDINEYHLHLMEVNKQYKTPRADDPKYLEFLQGIIEKEKIDLVHPQPDIEVKYIGKYRNQLNCKTFLPNQLTIANCQDKEFTALYLRLNKIPAPRTLPIIKYNKEEIILDNLNKKNLKMFLENLGIPVWVRATHGAGGRGSTIAYNYQTILNWCKYWINREFKWDFMVQQYLPGRNIGFHSLWKNGNLIVSMARERIEYIYPYLSPSGITGTPVVQRTIHNSEVNEIATQAIKTIDPKYTGVACVDLKEDKEGVPNITEINPGRFFTTSFFFSRAGLNFPYIYVKTALGEEDKLGYITQYNGLPEDFYWIRHIDCNAKLLRNGQQIGKM